jgi:hypothetical protein
VILLGVQVIIAENKRWIEGERERERAKLMVVREKVGEKVLEQRGTKLTALQRG